MVLMIVVQELVTLLLHLGFPAGPVIEPVTYRSKACFSQTLTMQLIHFISVFPPLLLVCLLALLQQALLLLVVLIILLQPNYYVRFYLR